MVSLRVIRLEDPSSASSIRRIPTNISPDQFIAFYLFNIHSDIRIPMLALLELASSSKEIPEKLSSFFLFIIRKPMSGRRESVESEECQVDQVSVLSDNYSFARGLGVDSTSFAFEEGSFPCVKGWPGRKQRDGS